MLELDAAGSASTVELLDAGAGPRRVLRYRPVEGTRAKHRLEIAIDLQMHLGDQPIPGSESLRTVHTTTRVTRVHEDGRVRRDWTLRAVAIEGSPGAERLVGTTGWELVDPNGRVLRSQYRLEESAEEEHRPLVDWFLAQRAMLAIPLAEGVVGIGARWRATTRLTASYVSTLDATYTLESLEGDVASVTIVGSLSAKPQELELEGGSSHLVSLTGNVGGRVTLDLAGLRTDAELSTHAVLELELGGPGGRKTILDTETRLRSRVAPSEP